MPDVKSVPLPELPTREYRPRIREFGKAAFLNMFTYFPILALHDESELAKAQAMADQLHARVDLVDGERDYLELLDLVIENFEVTRARWLDAGSTRPMLVPRERIDPLSTLTPRALATTGLVDAPGRPTPPSPLAEEPEPFHAPLEELSEGALADLATLTPQEGVPERILNMPKIIPGKNARRKR